MSSEDWKCLDKEWYTNYLQIEGQTGKKVEILVAMYSYVITIYIFNYQVLIHINTWINKYELRHNAESITVAQE